LKGPFYHLKEHVSNSRGANRFDMMRKGTLPPCPLKPLPHPLLEKEEDAKRADLLSTSLKKESV